MLTRLYAATSLTLVMTLVACTHDGSTPAKALTEGTDTMTTDPYLKELFSRRDDFNLVDKLFVRVSELCDGTDEKVLARLPESQRVVLDVWWSHGVIGNGGFPYLFESGIANIPGIAKSYDVIEVPRAAVAFREAMAVFPNSKPHADVDERLEYLEKLGAPVKEKLMRLSAEIWESDRRIKRNLAAYVRRHQTEYQSLRPSRWENIADFEGRDLPPPRSSAAESDVVAWLESIGATIRRWDEAAEWWTNAGNDIKSMGLPPNGNPIAAVVLSDGRNSTDEELSQLVCYKALQAVREIGLEGSYISGSGLDQLTHLPELRLLSLANTDIWDADLQRLKPLNSLISLKLSKTDITNGGLQVIGKLKSLERLDLSDTLVDDQGLARLASASNLRALELRNNRLTGAGLIALAELPLEELALWGTTVKDEHLEPLKRFERLKSIELTKTTIGDSALAHLSHASQLEELRLGSTQVTDNGLVHLAGLKNLTSLDLEVTPINGSGLKHLQSLSKLEQLSLYKTKCDDDGVAHLANIPSLQRLTLGDTNITDNCCVSLSRLKNLKSLSLSWTQLSGSVEIRQLEHLQSLKWISLPSKLEESPNVKYLQSKLSETEFSF